MVTLAALWEYCCDDGVTSDDIAEWEPANTDLLWKAQWRVGWRDPDGALYPIPTKAASSTPHGHLPALQWTTWTPSGGAS
jgi:hypothetical protein